MKIEVDKKFLMKMTGQIDKLSAEVKDLSKKKDEVDNDKSRFQFSITLQVADLGISGEMQKNFLDELKLLMMRYPVKKLSIDYKK